MRPRGHIRLIYRQLLANALVLNMTLKSLRIYALSMPVCLISLATTAPPFFLLPIEPTAKSPASYVKLPINIIRKNTAILMAI